MGVFGEVYLVVEPSKEADHLDKQFAMKVIRRKNLSKCSNQLEVFNNELEVLRGLHHPNIVHLVEVIDD